MILKKTGIFILVTLFHSASWAKGINSDIPVIQEVFRTSLVYPQGLGELEITFYPSFQNQRGKKNILFPIGIIYGFTDALSIGIYPTVYDFYERPGRSRNGMGDFAAEIQYSFMQIANTNYHAALFFDIQLPAGVQGISEGQQTYSPSIALAKDLPDIKLFSQFGFNFIHPLKHDTTPAAHEVFLNLGFYIPNKNLRYVLECNWVNDQWNHHGIENELYLTPGVIREFPYNWELGIGTSFGLTKTSDPYYILLTATVSMDLLQNRKS